MSRTAMKHRLVLSLGSILIAMAPGTAAAQFAVEARVGGSVGNHVPAAAGLETLPGLSVAGIAEYTAAPYASVYATFSRATFGCEDGFCTGDDVTMTAQGFGGGARLHRARLPWLRAGAVFYDTSVRSGSGTERTSGSLGLEVGTGFTVPLGRRVSLLPGAFYRTQGGADRTTLIGVDVGVRLNF